MNCELPDVHVGFRKGGGGRDQIGNICWIIKKAREFQKNIFFCFIDYTKAFDYAAAKSRQLCSTLCDPIDGGPPGSCPWDSPGKHTGVGCHCLLCNKAEVAVFLELSCFFDDPADVSNLISGSSAFSKSSSNILKAHSL